MEKQEFIEKTRQTLDMIFGYKNYKIDYEQLKFQKETEIWINIYTMSVVPNQLRWLTDYFKDPVPAVLPKDEKYICICIATDLSKF